MSSSVATTGSRDAIGTAPPAVWNSAPAAPSAPAAVPQQERIESQTRRTEDPTGGWQAAARDDRQPGTYELVGRVGAQRPAEDHERLALEWFCRERSQKMLEVFGREWRPFGLLYWARVDDNTGRARRRALA
jgi:hypothetical protein